MLSYVNLEGVPVKGWTSSLVWYYSGVAVGQIRELDGVTFFGSRTPSVHLECSLNNCNILTSMQAKVKEKQCETKNQSKK